MENKRNLGQLAEKLATYFKTETTAITAYIFGSFGTERQNSSSDLDIAVLYDERIPVLKEMEHAAEISSLLQMEKVDLVNLNKAPVHLQHEILYTGTKIFDRVPERTKDFIENMLEIYHDYQGILNKYRNDLREGLMEEHFNG